MAWRWVGSLGKKMAETEGIADDDALEQKMASLTKSHPLSVMKVPLSIPITHFVHRNSKLCTVAERNSKKSSQFGLVSFLTFRFEATTFSLPLITISRVLSKFVSLVEGNGCGSPRAAGQQGC